MENNRKANSESRKRGTQTSAFGAAGRINHDASAFYGSKLYIDQEPPVPHTWIETPIPSENLDQLYCASSTDMSAIPDNSIHLMVTSPPYNAKKEYDDDLSLAEYRELLYAVFAETYKKMVTGGRACINIANLGRKPYIPLHSFIIEDMLEIATTCAAKSSGTKAEVLDLLLHGAVGHPRQTLYLGMFMNTSSFSLKTLSLEKAMARRIRSKKKTS